MTKLTASLYSLKALAARPLRVGGRQILWTPTRGLGFGNFLYLWLHAHLLQEQGHNYRVLATPAMKTWLDAFPLIYERLAVERSAVRVWDRREWPSDTLYQSFGSDYSREQLRNFINTYISAELGPVTDSGEVVVLNVRRGDYYSVPHYREVYGFNIAGYVREALAAARSVAPVGSIVVVSDDPRWCERNLHEVLSSYSDHVEYVTHAAGPLANFRTVATADRLIGTNSTFSYWGGYVADVIRDDAQIIMPVFHGRWQADSSSYQLDPRWTTIRDVPGGWDELVP